MGRLLAMKDKVYGTTAGGGTYGYGTVFTLGLNSGLETVLYSFQYGCDAQNPSAGVIPFRGKFYGTTPWSCGAVPAGTLFALDRANHTEAVLHRFDQEPLPGYGSLLDVNGRLFGTTTGGGAYGHGTLFMFDTRTGGERTVYSFCGQHYCPDGSTPEAGLIEVNGLLYGTTYSGGANTDYGTVFVFDPTNGSEKVLFSFGGRPNTGIWPYADVIDVNGTLYGATIAGGVTNTSTICGGGPGCGTVFAVDEATGAGKVVYSFCQLQNCSDGALPYGGLVALNGLLYGTTVKGGAGTFGTVYSLNPQTGAETVLHSFKKRDGYQPFADLIAVNGKLYGVASRGGPNFGRDYVSGTVFSVTP